MKSVERTFAKSKSKDWSHKTRKGRKAQRHAARHRGKLSLKKGTDK